MTTTEVPAAVRTIAAGIDGAWPGWDWTHDPGSCECDLDAGGIALSGPGAVEDWAAWESERSVSLRRAGHSARCAASVASDEREYGERAQSDADGAADEWMTVAACAARGAWRSAVEAAERAASIESEYGDDPVYGPALDELRTVAREACYEAAMSGLRIRRGETAAVIDDGVDRWACTRDALEAARDEMPLIDLDGDDGHMAIYTALCEAVEGAVLSAQGTSRGEPDEQIELARAVVADGLEDEDDVARLWDIEVGEMEVAS